jgi:hypothetical protein
MRANTILMIVAAGAGDMMTVRRGTTTAGIVIMSGPHATTTEGLFANHAITIAAMMIIDGTE